MAGLFQSITFVGETSGQVKKLPGWLKHHRLPDSVNPTTLGFVRKIGDKLIQEQTDELFQTLRQAFGYKRKDQRVSPDTGWAEIETPHFTTGFRLELDEENPSRYLIQQTVGNFASEAVLDMEPFATVFNNRFALVRCETGSNGLDVEGVIDRIEDMDPDTTPLRVWYPPAAERCTINIEGFEPELLVQPHAVTLSCPHPAPVAELVMAAKQLPAILGCDEETEQLLLTVEDSD